MPSSEGAAPGQGADPDRSPDQLGGVVTLKRAHHKSLPLEEFKSTADEVRRRSSAKATRRLTQPERDSHLLKPRRRTHDRVADENGIVRDPRDRANERAQNATPRPVPQPDRGKEQGPIDIREAKPSDIQVNIVDRGDTQLAYSQVYDLSAHTGEPTYALFGAWQTDQEQGFVAVTQSPDGTDVQIDREDRGERDIETELTDRISQVIEQSQAQQASTAHEPSSPEMDRELQHDQPPQLEHDPAQLGPPDHQPEREPVEREPYIEQAIQAAQERQQAWEHGIEQDRENDRGFGIE
jgi:hypothetical protein